MPDNIYPDQSNDKFDIQYARLLGLSSDLRASFGVEAEVLPPGKFGPIETPSDVDTGIVRFGVANEDDTATENRSFDLAGEFSFAITQQGNNQFLVDPANGLYQLGAVPVPGSDSGLSYTYIEIEDNDKKITLQAPEGIVLPGYGYGNHTGTYTKFLAVDAGGNMIEVDAAVGGSGTVTSFSAGNLSPLFTTSVATATTTPALSFALSNAAGGTVFGNNGSSSAAPAFTSTPVLGIAGTTLGTLGLAGNTSGVITIKPQAAAGTFNFNLPITAGTSGYLLTSGGGGGAPMTWTDPSTLGAGSITADNGLSMSTATNVQLGGTGIQNTNIDWGNFTFSNTWNSLSGVGISLSATSTAAASSNQKLFTIGTAGANANSGQTTYGIAVTNTHTGTTSSNVAGSFSASGGTNNYALIVPANSGFVGIGTPTPITLLHVEKDATIANVDDANIMIRNLSRLTLNGTALTAAGGKASYGNYNIILLTLTADQTIPYQAGISSSQNLVVLTNAVANSDLTITQSGYVEALSATLNTISMNAFAASSTISHVANTVIGSFYPGSGLATAGTITNYYGLLISTQTDKYAGSNAVFTNIWGIYQEGVLDRNWFHGKTAFGTSNAPVMAMHIVGGRGSFYQGADVASVNGAIALGEDGNTFEITGTNSITLISNLKWQNGSEVNLIFTSTATLTDGTANSGTDIGMELAGATNFTGSADDMVTLVLSEVGGVQRWREKCRSVN